MCINHLISSSRNFGALTTKERRTAGRTYMAVAFRQGFSPAVALWYWIGCLKQAFKGC